MNLAAINSIIKRLINERASLELIEFYQQKRNELIWYIIRPIKGNQ